MRCAGDGTGSNGYPREIFVDSFAAPDLAPGQAVNRPAQSYSAQCYSEVPGSAGSSGADEDTCSNR